MRAALFRAQKPRNPYHRIHLQSLALLLIFLWTGCSLPQSSSVPTPYPTQVLPTIIAQTMQAIREQNILPSPPISTSATPFPPTDTPLPNPTPTNSPTPDQALSLPQVVTPPSSAPLPEAVIQIRLPGPLSRVASPIFVQAYLKPGKGGQVQVDLYGEDWRTLVRQVKPLPYINRYGFAMLYTSLTYEIPGTAEAGWLTLSVNDEYGRVTSVNSVPLILMSIGEADIVLPADVYAPIVIQQPAPMTLIQGKKLIVSGLARSGGDTYLMLQLIAQDGRVLGKRVTNVLPPDEGSMGSFTVEVPYEVEEATSALLVVWQGEGSLSNVIYLSSVEVLLSP